MATLDMNGQIKGQTNIDDFLYEEVAAEAFDFEPEWLAQVESWDEEAYMTGDV